MHSFRVNLGNGQVDRTVHTRKDAFKLLAFHLPDTPYAYIEFQDGSE